MIKLLHQVNGKPQFSALRNKQLITVNWLHLKFFLGLLLLAVVASPARANPGDLIKNINLAVAGSGVSVAADCTGVIYYTIGDTKLYKMDKNGVDLGNVSILAGTTPVDIDEIAWDNGRKILWGNQHASNPVAIYKIDPTTGAATKAFDSQTTSIGTFRDGLAYDATDDSLWESGDVSTTIEHYKASDGTLINTITPKNATGGALGSISGVVVGVGDLLYLGQNGREEIVQVKKSDGSFIEVFSSPGGARDEGLECDAVNFAPKTALLSREFNSPGFVSVIELSGGTCGCGGAPPVPQQSQAVPTMTEWGVIIFMVLAGIASVYQLRRIRRT